MHINVFFDNIPFHRIKRECRAFFFKTQFKHRNGVYVHPDEDSVISVSPNTMHIHIPNGDVEYQKFVNLLLKRIFRDKVIGINRSNENRVELLNTLNYVLI